jgi:hypothetical protein
MTMSDKKINIDCCCEFGYELQLVIPYAYYLFQHNLLNRTTSCLNTKELYYFSNSHSEAYKTRRYNEPNVPNKTPHLKELNYEKYTPPPYKNIYKNDYFVYEKPLLIIHNKYNEEWSGPPVNFIDKPILSEIFRLYSDKYTIIYLRPRPSHIVTDDSPTHDLKESPILKLYNIIDGIELYERTKQQYKIRNFNHFQLLIHANCDNFISVQGGNCVLASYFGGTNIIYAKCGGELTHDSYNGHYGKYSGCNVLHTDNYPDLMKLIKNNF